MWHTCQHPWSSSSLGIEQHSPLFGISLLAPCLHPGEMELQISRRIDILVALRQPCLGKSHHAAVPEVSLESNVPWSKKTQKNKLRTPSCHSLLCDGHPIMWPQWLYGVTWLSGFLCFLFVIVGCEGTVVCVVIVQIKLKCKLRLQKSSFCFSEQLRASGAFTAPSRRPQQAPREQAIVFFTERTNTEQRRRSLWLQQKHLYRKQLIWHITSKDKWSRILSLLGPCGDFINLHHVCSASLLQWSQCHIPDVSLSGLAHPYISSQGQRSPASGYHLAGPAVADQSPTRLNVLTAVKL